MNKALKMARRAVALEPENGAYLDTIGWIFYKLGNYQEALRFIRQAVSGRENTAEVLEHLGDVYDKLGDTGNARQYWQKALEQEPDNENLKNKLHRESPDFK